MHFLWRVFWVFLLFCLTYNKVAAIPFILHSESETNYIPGKYLEILKVSDSLSSLGNAINSSEWKPVNQTGYLTLPETNTWFWIRLTVRNSGSVEGNWILEFPDIHNSELQLVEFNYKGERKEHALVGFDLDFKKRVYRHKNYFFNIRLPAGEQATLYVRIKSNYPSSYAMYFRSIEYLFSYSLSEYYFLGIFYGILFIMALYNFFIFIFTREKSYFYYVLYVLAGLIYAFSEDGTGFQFLWPGLPFLNHLFFSYAPLFLIGTFLLYAFEFLEFRKRSSSFTFYLWIYLGAYTSLTLLPFSLPGGLRAFLFIAPFLAVYVYSIQLYSKGFLASRLFIAGFSVILISFILYLLRMLEWIPSNLYTLYVFNFGMILEVMILSYALGDKMRLLKTEKVAAQQKTIEHLLENEKLKDKVNRELESKVTERTFALNEKTNELTIANQKLEELTKKLDFMNSQLDLDNWNLKKQVKEETKSRILLEKVSYEEFLKIYPNENYCLQYLEELKWEKGFQCKKCQNTSYSKGEKLFSRKCNRCKYSESATSGTLFHGIKFPLNQAFYIVYDTCNENSRSTIDQLAEVIGLRRATVWSFRKKVEESKSFQKNNSSGWESMILQE